MLTALLKNVCKTRSVHILADSSKRDVERHAIQVTFWDDEKVSMTIWTASKRKSAPRSSTSAVTNTRRPHRREQQKKQRLAAALRLVLAVVHHRDTNVTHADVTRRRGWPFIVVGLGIGSVARQAAQLSASGWRGRGVPTARHCQRAARPDPGRGRRLHAGPGRRLGNTQIRPSRGPA